jgi:P27 family predicted phage terminase small subunit
MAGQRQPINLVVAKGKKHLTKAEIEERKAQEIIAPCDKVRPPSYLTTKQRKEFKRIAQDLMELELMANLDCDALARLIIAQDQYVEITQRIRGMPLIIDRAIEVEGEIVGMEQVVNEERERLMNLQDKAIKQCRQGAMDFGMTVSSRCKLVVPKAPQDKPENKFAKYAQ